MPLALAARSCFVGYPISSQFESEDHPHVWFNLEQCAALRRNILCVVHVDNQNVLVNMCGKRWQLCRRHRHDGTSGASEVASAVR